MKSNKTRDTKAEQSGITKIFKKWLPEWGKKPAFKGSWVPPPLFGIARGIKALLKKREFLKELVDEIEQSPVNFDKEFHAGFIEKIRAQAKRLGVTEKKDEYQRKFWEDYSIYYANTAKSAYEQSDIRSISKNAWCYVVAAECLKEIPGDKKIPADNNAVGLYYYYAANSFRAAQLYDRAMEYYEKSGDCFLIEEMNVCNKCSFRKGFSWKRRSYLRAMDTSRICGDFVREGRVAKSLKELDDKEIYCRKTRPDLFEKPVVSEETMNLDEPTGSPGEYKKEFCDEVLDKIRDQKERIRHPGNKPEERNNDLEFDLFVDSSKIYANMARLTYGKSDIVTICKNAWYYVVAAKCLEGRGIRNEDVARHYHFAANSFRFAQLYDPALKYYKESGECFFNCKNFEWAIRSFQRASGVAKICGDWDEEKWLKEKLDEKWVQEKLKEIEEKEKQSREASCGNNRTQEASQTPAQTQPRHQPPTQSEAPIVPAVGSAPTGEDNTSVKIGQTLAELTKTMNKLCSRLPQSKTPPNATAAPFAGGSSSDADKTRNARIKTGIKELKIQYQALAGMNFDGLSRKEMQKKRQARGYAFEKLLKKLFELYDLSLKGSYKAKGDQIDGAFKYGTLVYLIEAKWTRNAPIIDKAIKFASKVRRRRSKDARGLMISIAGFDAKGIKDYQRELTELVFMNGNDIENIVNGKKDFMTWFEEKRQDDILYPL